MTARPHDVTDLYLAPVALGLDHRVEELAGLSAEEVHYRVVLGTDREPHTIAQREGALVETLTRGLELHGWQVSVRARGLMISHDSYALVLGMPSSVLSYLKG